MPNDLSPQTEANKAAVRALVAAHNRQDAAEAASFFSDDATNHGRAAGRAGMGRVYRSLYQAFPDFHWEIRSLIGEEDRVAAAVLMTGTHRGMPELPVFGGLIHREAPTGKAVSVLNMHLYRFRDGLIVEHAAVRDDLVMMQQLGLLPPSPLLDPRASGR